MLEIRKAEERGCSKLSWLDSWHSFSFGGYMDPKHMGFGVLRVINEDRVIPGAGFEPHSHRDMEIISYVIEGELGHRDSMGNGSVIRPGEVQRMSAGTGITHSEMNSSKDKPVHFLQIWVLPEKKGISPSYEQKSFASEARQDFKSLQNQWRLIGSRDGREGSVTIHQDVSLYVANLAQGQHLSYELSSKRKIWLQIVRGSLQLDGQALKAGDGMAIAEQGSFCVVSATADTEVLLFDLAEC